MPKFPLKNSSVFITTVFNISRQVSFSSGVGTCPLSSFRAQYWEVFSYCFNPTQQILLLWGSPGGSVVNNPPANQRRRQGFNPWVRKILWRRNGNQLQGSYLENPTDWGVWWATVHGVAKSQTWLSNRTHTAHSLVTIPWWQVPTTRVMSLGKNARAKNGQRTQFFGKRGQRIQTQSSPGPGKRRCYPACEITLQELFVRYWLNINISNQWLGTIFPFHLWWEKKKRQQYHWGFFVSRRNQRGLI